MTDAQVKPPPKKRGRKSSEEEARAYLLAQGIDPDDLLGPLDNEPMPETNAEFAEEFRKLIWKRRHGLGDTAFTQLLTAFTKLAEAARETETPDTEPLIADVIAGIVHLEPERKRAILEAELASLDAERDRILEVLNA